MQKDFEQYADEVRRGLNEDNNGLYIAGELAGVVYLVSSAETADSLHDCIGGCVAAPRGKWSAEPLRGRPVVVLSRNRPAAGKIAAKLHGVAKFVRVADIPQDIPSLIAEQSPAEVGKLLSELARNAPEWEPKPDPLLSLFKRLEDFPEEDAEWLIPGWIPKGQISLIAADGGIGKTTLWCHIIAALSSGRACVLDPPGFIRESIMVMFLTTEDSVRKKLRKKLRLAGANMKNIITPDFVGDRSGLLHKLKFGTKEMERALRTFRPALCIFDPVQGFTPPKVNMGSRNEMRDCMAPLIAIGEDIDTTSIVVCHTNKRKGASGRDRIADSADLWDIARSVMMAGYTEDQGVRYLSNEKNNYSQLQETVLFTIDSDGQIQKDGTSWKRDRDYILGAEIAKSAPKREDCKAFILQTLEEAGGTMPTTELEAVAKASGHSFTAVKRAKKELKDDGIIKYFHTGSPRDRVWHMQLVNLDGFTETSEDGPSPFDEPLPV